MTKQPPNEPRRTDSASLARATHYAQTVSARARLREAFPWPQEGEPVHPRVIAAAASVPRIMTPLVWPPGVRYEHWSAAQYPVANDIARRQMQWMKSVGIVGLLILTDGNAGEGPNDGDSGLGFATMAVQEGLDVAVRYYRSVEHGWTNAMSKATEAYLRIGVNKIQTTNEPDLLTVEWAHKPDPAHWLEIAFQYWMNDAHMLNSLGAWPISPPMASGVFRQRDAGAGYWGPDLNPFLWCREQGIELICGVHAYLLNHPADYPDDPVNQTGAPLTREEYDWASEGGRWPQAWGADTLEQVNAWRASDANPGDTIFDDDCSGRVFEVYEKKLDEAAYTFADLASWEGWAVNMNRQDRRYPGNTPPVMLANNLAHFRYLGAHPHYRGNAGWIFTSGSGGWASDQHFHPGVPEANSDGYLFAVAGLAAYPKEDDFAAPPEPPPPEPPPDPEPEEPPVEPTINDATAYGVTIQPVSVPAGAWYWRVTRVHHLTPVENNGMHNAFADVLADNGMRVPVASVRVTNANGAITHMICDKPLTEPAGNCPIGPADTLALMVESNEPSEAVAGIHTRHPDEGPVTSWGHAGNSTGHHSFAVTWRWTKAVDAPPEPPPPPPPEPGHTSQVFELHGGGSLTLVFDAAGQVVDLLMHL